ncbi:MAG TPA: phosphatase PAP2 family protein [Solirubrobacteraceae bacterium]|jgi:membrane-associated phospholipid phosphatase|nr:phosphatase PAP2 family protein [Solirubrobacteraceae bacterium]
MFRQRSLWLVAASCAAALGAEGAMAFVVPGARSLDAHALQAFEALGQNAHVLRASAAVISATPAAIAILTALLALIALRDGRRTLAVAIPLATIGAVLSADLLKSLIDETRFSAALGYNQLTASSWPSGHSTAAMMGLLCALLVAPQRLRRVVAVAGSAAVLLVCCSLLVQGVHYPSDVLGGMLLAGLWTSLTLAVVRRSGERSDAHVALREPVAGAAAGVLVALAGAAALASIGLPVGGALLLATATLGLVAAALGAGIASLN